MRDLNRCLKLVNLLVCSNVMDRTILQLFNLYIDHLSLRMIFGLLIILQLPQDLFELLIPSRVVVLFRILQSLILGLGHTVSTSSSICTLRLKSADLETIVLPLKLPAKLLKLFFQSCRLAQVGPRMLQPLHVRQVLGDSSL
jgi:hypothetical protein